jgi:hypothetical protein
MKVLHAVFALIAGLMIAGIFLGNAGALSQAEGCDRS